MKMTTFTGFRLTNYATLHDFLSCIVCLTVQTTKFKVKVSMLTDKTVQLHIHMLATYSLPAKLQTVVSIFSSDSQQARK